MIAATVAIVGVAVLALLGRIAFQSSQLDTALDEAQARRDPQPIVEAVEELSDDDAATNWDYALDQLWQAYDRELAAEVLVEAAERSDASILQYWMQQVLQVEPDVADDVFTEAFLQRHYDPKTADRCGKSGCCG